MKDKLVKEGNLMKDQGDLEKDKLVKEGNLMKDSAIEEGINEGVSEKKRLINEGEALKKKIINGVIIEDVQGKVIRDFIRDTNIDSTSKFVIAVLIIIISIEGLYIRKLRNILVHQ